MTRLPYILLFTLPLAGCFTSDDNEPVLSNLESAIDSNYTVNEGSLYSTKIPKMKGELLLAHSDIKGVSIDAVADGWVFSFKAPWVTSLDGNLVQSKSYSVTLQQKVNEFEERKKTVSFNVMDIKSVPIVEFDLRAAKPSSLTAEVNKEDKDVVIVRTRSEHGFSLPFTIIEEDADDVSLGLSISQEASALSGATIEQVSSDNFRLIVPIDIQNPLKDIDISLAVSDLDGTKTYTIKHRRLITPKIDVLINGSIVVRKDTPAKVLFKKNFTGDDYHFEIKYYDKDMTPTDSNVWIEHKLSNNDDYVLFSVSAVPERWDGIAEIVVIRDGEKGVHHYPISVR